ncbi:MAG: aminotransferase class I/II-fold pyridoxal phosphate-dependent enzyme [Bacteroidetes bacterium]|nr:MAG: aminotransferase class I/II-fold pyridoxal phosphate-dependent enzyme [Bacteroidota bacterium]
MSHSHFETLAIREQMERTAQNEHAAPLFLTSSFTFDSAEGGAALFSGESDGNLYSRFSNPNTSEFARKLALLEGYNHGIATASGMAAVFTAFAALVKSGDHIVAAANIFGNSLHILQAILPNMGVACTLVEVNDNAAFEQAIQPNTKLIFVESPANPTLTLADLSFLGKLCAEKGLLFLVDNCFATPYLQQPKRYGAHLVIHSATKYIDGQGRVLGGAIVGNETEVGACYDFIRRTGATLSPFNAWVLSKSLETLAVRMDRHCSNAQLLCDFLKSHSEVEEVIYPHDIDNPQYELAKAQMSQGGGLVGCVVRGGAERGAKFLNALQMHSLTANLGDTRSIATHPASTTHSKLSKEQQLAVGISPGFLRFSVGLEHHEDIINDVERALEKSK